jgi:protein-S-isoprenylcysteine O-methyltransferase Ste14
MTAEERARWMWETRLKQLVAAEAKAWRRLAWGAGIYCGLLLLIPVGVLLADSSIGVYASYAKSTRPEGVRIAGLMLQGFGWTILYLLGIPVLLRSARWIEAMRQRRRFSSTPGADPGQLPQR